jgi:hypothetical protein
MKSHINNKKEGLLFRSIVSLSALSLSSEISPPLNSVAKCDQINICEPPTLLFERETFYTRFEFEDF